MATMQETSISIIQRRRGELWLIALQIGILLALLLMWQVSVSQRNLMFFSRPTLVGARLYELFANGEIYPHILVTMQEVLIGYVLGAALGLVLGFILGRNRIL